jgi:hypothetical protein
MLRALKRPSAWVPLALTVAMLGVLGLYFAGIIPPDPTGDEGTGAHLFQIWLVLEVFAIVLFGVKWLAAKPRETLMIVGLQVLLALIPLSIVFSLHL